MEAVSSAAAIALLPPIDGPTAGARNGAGAGSREKPPHCSCASRIGAGAKEDGQGELGAAGATGAYGSTGPVLEPTSSPNAGGRGRRSNALLQVGGYSANRILQCTTST